MKKNRLFLIIFGGMLVMSCNRPEANYEGVLMTDYGRNGIKDFNVVTGAQGPLGPGSELYQVPMWEQKGKNVRPVGIAAKDAGIFTCDPEYTYQAIRGKGPEIIFSYKHLGANDGDEFFNNIEHNVLNKMVYDAFRVEARKYSTDSLMNNMADYENKVELKLTAMFASKFFKLNTLTSGLIPPRSMAAAIEARNNAVQKANQVRNEIETSKLLLEKSRIDAETNRVKSAGLTKEVLQQQYIEAIRNTRNKIIITDGKTPIILGQ